MSREKIEIVQLKT